MAAAFNPAELNNLLECGICLNRYQDPRVLPCLHSYCLECLKSHISSSKDANCAFNCPQCRETCLLPGGGVDKFPKNFFVNMMKDVLPESILQEPPLRVSKSSDPKVCKHQNGKDKHGEAVMFCVQCDAHFCQLCTKHHGMFAKDHNVTPVGDKRGTETTSKPSANCKLHQNLAINWYCQSCSLPVCAECLAEKHKDHNTEKLVHIEATLKLDMLNVSKMAAKRIDVFQKLSGCIKANEHKMKDDLDKVSRDISDTANSLCKLIRQHERTLQDQLKKAKQKARKILEQADEDNQRTKRNILRLKSEADTLQQAPTEHALSTVWQAKVTKQQYLNQQNTAVKSVQWRFEKQPSKPMTLLKETTFLGSVDCDISQRSHRAIQAENVSLGSPLHVIHLEYKGKGAICSIAPIYKSMVCVAHFGEQRIWVYSESGLLLRKVNIPGIERITGMVAVDGKTGKLAVVDGQNPKIHFVSLTGLQHAIKEVSMIPQCVSLNQQGHIVVGSQRKGEVLVLKPDGQIISDIKVVVPNTTLGLGAIQHTKSGLVVFCDTESKRVYFLYPGGPILHTSKVCTNPLDISQTSWGHILVSEANTGSIIVLSEAGGHLGKICDRVNAFLNPSFIHVYEADKALYVGCGQAGKQEVRRYKMVSGDLPLSPVAHINICDISVNVKLNTS